jgi:hypothetical protein
MEEDDGISGNILVYSPLKYSFQNLHIPYHEQLLSELRLSLKMNIEQKSVFEKYLLENETGSHMIEQKIQMLENEIKKEQTLVEKIEKEEGDKDEIYNLNGNKTFYVESEVETNLEKKEQLKKTLYKIVNDFKLDCEKINFNLVYNKLVKVILLGEEIEVDYYEIQKNLEEMIDVNYNSQPFKNEYIYDVNIDQNYLNSKKKKK